jgi:hypothetical protein
MDTIDASNNWWGVADSASIEDLVYHHADTFRFPTVDYVPFAESAFEFEDPTAADGIEIPSANLPLAFTLHQNYPNPFNTVTNIEFYIQRQCHVSISVYNVLGQHVKSILNESMPVGQHSVAWDGTDYRGRAVSSGVYFYRLYSSDYAETRKMLLLK